MVNQGRMIGRASGCVFEVSSARNLLLSRGVEQISKNAGGRIQSRSEDLYGPVCPGTSDMIHELDSSQR